jgi:ERCC4-type nuclease
MLMQSFKYSFSDSEIKQLLSSMVILVDTREQQNGHILNYFDSKKISYKEKKLDYGDYSAYLPKNEGLGIQRDIFLSPAIERKNSVDELAGSVKERIRFEKNIQVTFLMKVQTLNHLLNLQVHPYLFAPP